MDLQQIHLQLPLQFRCIRIVQIQIQVQIPRFRRNVRFMDVQVKIDPRFR